MTETEVKPVIVALIVAYRVFPVRLRRLCRLHVVLPDFGRPFIQTIGFFRYEGERPFKATAQELQFLRRLTITL